MKKLFFFLVLLFYAQFTQLKAQNNLPYPIIFVHGLTGSDETFIETMQFMKSQYGLGNINIFDVVLNADNDDESSLMSEDVKWTDFYYGGRYINVGRRNYAEDIDDFRDGWTGTNLFAINFKEERIRGAAGFWNDYFDYGDQAGIFKQGYALGKMIQEVLDYTGAKKVILVGHSMGGLCIREYLQRTDENGIHVNWVEPYAPDGHHVARVATYGTPHIGSNAGFDPSKGETPKSGLPDQNTEASRDLKWSYDDYTHCGGLTQGIYMFGGNEYCIKGTWYNPTFTNVDINCNGSENDDIIGINESFYSYDYNHDMPLPLNIKYTWMTSIWGSIGSLTGDGAVEINRQWIHVGSIPSPIGLADTTLNNILHTSEGTDYKTIIRGIDEPEDFNLAYTLQLDRTVLGFITYHQNMVAHDEDIYRIEKQTGMNAVAATIDGWVSGAEKLEFYDENGNLLTSRIITSFPAKLYVNIPEGNQEVYLKITGTATNYTWKYPYKLTVTSGSWTGTYSDDWNNPSNWTYGLPDQYDDVFVPANANFLPTINNSVVCNRLGVEQNATLTLEPTAAIKVYGATKLYGDVLLKSDLSDNTSSFIDNGDISGSGTVTLERIFQTGSYHYISSHVSNGSSSVFTDLENGQTNPNFYAYDETSNNSDWLYGWIQTSGIMQVAKGYAYFASSEQSVFDLAGSPNTGNISVQITNSNFGISSDGWNLIGNPYPSAVSADDFLLLNYGGAMQGAIYLWDKNEYDVYNLSGYVSQGNKTFNGNIAPGQAFFVKALNSGNVYFNNSLRTLQNSVFFKNNDEDINRIYINLSNETYSGNILIGFSTKATDDYDQLYDADQIKANPEFSFYSELDDKDLVIQTLSPLENTKIIKLGADINQTGNYIFKFDSLNNIPAEFYIYLKDNNTGTYINLRENNEYITEIEAGTNRNRFEIVFTKSATEINPVENKYNIYANGNIIYYTIPESKTAQVIVYNSLGKICATETSAEESNTITLNTAPGIYIVKIIDNNHITTQKVMIGK